MKYTCSNCESEFLRWEGKCSSCGEWGSLVEKIEEISVSKIGKGGKVSPSQYVVAKNLKGGAGVGSRLTTGLGELDRVVGGGLVGGSVTLLAGEPGVGKSTLLLQVALDVAKTDKVLYVSCEESASQLNSRLKRLFKSSDKGVLENLLVVEDTDVDRVAQLVRDLKPRLFIVDSIQAVSSEQSRSIAGSIGQVRVSGSILTRVAKDTGVPLVLVGQITKQGSIAGPKVLEHLVDTVLYFEGGGNNPYRIVRSIKNRFGKTDEIGVFEMVESGLRAVDNPSQVFLESSLDVPGSAIGAMVKGSRVVFIEVQALVVERGAEAGPLKRVANGMKKPRLDMLCAVLSRRGGVYLGDMDVYVNVVGGITVDDPLVDLVVCAAIKSSVKDKVVDKKTVYVGEVVLTGEVRGGMGVSVVVKEASRLGYKSVVLGKSANVKGGKIVVEKLTSIRDLK